MSDGERNSVSKIKTQPLTVFELSQRGRVQGCALSADELRRSFPRNRRVRITSHVEPVGIVQGHVKNWNGDKPSRRPRLKVHWVCPQCGHEAWARLESSDT